MFAINHLFMFIKSLRTFHSSLLCRSIYHKQFPSATNNGTNRNIHFTRLKNEAYARGADRKSNTPTRTIRIHDRKIACWRWFRARKVWSFIACPRYSVLYSTSLITLSGTSVLLSISCLSPNITRGLLSTDHVEVWSVGRVVLVKLERIELNLVAIVTCRGLLTLLTIINP